MELEKFNAKFVYKADTMDTWRVLTEPYEGDCDDYACTVLWFMEGSWLRFWWSVFIFKAVFWLVLDKNGERHIVLSYSDKGYIDNHYPYWRDTMEPHKKKWPIPLPVVLWQMFWGKVWK
jgi:hypothetical protein